MSNIGTNFGLCEEIKSSFSSLNNDQSVEAEVQHQILNSIANNNLKQAHSTLCTFLRSSDNVATKLSIESSIVKLEREIGSRTTLLTEEGDSLFRDNKYQEASEKFQEALLHAVVAREISVLEDKREAAQKAATVKRLNNEATALCQNDDFAAGLDKFEEALNYVENDFLFDLIEGNIEIVNKLMVKKYMVDADGRPRIGEIMPLLLKFAQDCVAGKV